MDDNDDNFINGINHLDADFPNFQKIEMDVNQLCSSNKNESSRSPNCAISRTQPGPFPTNLFLSHQLRDHIHPKPESIEYSSGCILGENTRAPANFLYHQPSEYILEDIQRENNPTDYMANGLSSQYMLGDSMPYASNFPQMPDLDDHPQNIGLADLHASQNFDVDDLLRFSPPDLKPTPPQDYKGDEDGPLRAPSPAILGEKLIDIIVGTPDIFVKSHLGAIAKQQQENNLKQNKDLGLGYMFGGDKETLSPQHFNSFDMCSSPLNYDCRESKIEDLGPQDGLEVQEMGKENLEYSEASRYAQRPMKQEPDDEHLPNWIFSGNKDILTHPHLGTSQIPVSNDITAKTLSTDPELEYVGVQNDLALGCRSGPRTWKCNICEKQFRHQYTLTRHLPTHTGERNYKCDTCGKAFRQMSTLSQHRAIHSDARPYICEFCKKTFNRVSTLISHKKIHNDYKPHKCQRCGKSFHQKGNLRNHVFTHTNERPYKCDKCGKGFNQMSNLMCHRVHTHPDGTFSCQLCNQVFKKKMALKSHEMSAHNMHRSFHYENGSKDSKVTAGAMKNGAGDAPSHTSTNSGSGYVKRIVSNSGNTQATLTQQKRMSTRVIIIDPIRTAAMTIARQNGHTPFALFQPLAGQPFLVKVLDAYYGTKHKLVPATSQDITCYASNAKQIKVHVVATLLESLDQLGNLGIRVTPPGHNLQLPKLKCAGGGL